MRGGAAYRDRTLTGTANCIRCSESTHVGLESAVGSAIDWFFEQVEEGIILEDDCRPSAVLLLFLSRSSESLSDGAAGHAYRRRQFSIRAEAGRGFVLLFEVRFDVGMGHVATCLGAPPS